MTYIYAPSAHITRDNSWSKVTFRHMYSFGERMATKNSAEFPMVVYLICVWHCHTQMSNADVTLKWAIISKLIITCTLNTEVWQESSGWELKTDWLTLTCADWTLLVSWNVDKMK